MRFVIQRVSHAQVTIDGQVRGSIQKGYMVLIGIGQGGYRGTCRPYDRQNVGSSYF